MCCLFHRKLPNSNAVLLIQSANDFAIEFRDDQNAHRVKDVL